MERVESSKSDHRRSWEKEEVLHWRKEKDGHVGVVPQERGKKEDDRPGRRTTTTAGEAGVGDLAFKEGAGTDDEVDELPPLDDGEQK